MPSKPSRTLETFPNPTPRRDYRIHMEIPEFTCLCPKTGQPDFATLVLDYVPDKLCVELKSLKLYIWSYRNEGAFHEAVTNRILDDLVAATKPRFMRLTARFYVRGGHLHDGRGRACKARLEIGGVAGLRGRRRKPKHSASCVSGVRSTNVIPAKSAWIPDHARERAVRNDDCCNAANLRNMTLRVHGQILL